MSVTNAYDKTSQATSDDRHYFNKNPARLVQRMHKISGVFF